MNELEILRLQGLGLTKEEIDGTNERLEEARRMKKYEEGKVASELARIEREKNKKPECLIWYFIDILGIVLGTSLRK